MSDTIETIVKSVSEEKRGSPKIMYQCGLMEFEDDVGCIVVKALGMHKVGLGMRIGSESDSSFFFFGLEFSTFFMWQ